MSIVQKLHLSGVCIVSILNKFLVDENKKKCAVEIKRTCFAAKGDHASGASLLTIRTK